MFSAEMESTYHWFRYYTTIAWFAIEIWRKVEESNPHPYGAPVFGTGGLPSARTFLMEHRVRIELTMNSFAGCRFAN